MKKAKLTIYTKSFDMIFRYQFKQYFNKWKRSARPISLARTKIYFLFIKLKIDYSLKLKLIFIINILLLFKLTAILCKAF